MTRDSGPFIGALLLVLISVVLLEAQSGRGNVSSSIRVISIPVTVIDKNGDYVTGLTESNFSVSEGGHAIALESIQEVTPVVVTRNKVKVPFLLLDGLGSPDQNETRKECLQILADFAAKDLPISLSEIDKEGLHEVHGVATSNPVLASALLQLDDENHFLSHRDELQATVKPSDDKSLVEAEAERLRQFRRGKVELANMMSIVLAQLNALQRMAVALQNAKGRKTVVWLTGFFPVDVNEAQDSLNINAFGTTSGFPVQTASIDYQKTIDLLNDAQVSVFPIEMKWSRPSSNLPGALLADLNIVGLRRVARSTGGEEMAFADRLDNLVRRAEDRSTGYYLLKFKPETSRRLKWNTLKIEVTEKSLQVMSPDGLFSFPPK